MVDEATAAVDEVVVGAAVVVDDVLPTSEVVDDAEEGG